MSFFRKSAKTTFQFDDIPIDKVLEKCSSALNLAVRMLLLNTVEPLTDVRRQQRIDCSKGFERGIKLFLEFLLPLLR